MTSPVPAVSVSKVPGNTVLLDVRENDEWAAGHAPGAVHVPMEQVPQRLDELAAAFPDRPVHVVCRSGGRSARITAYLAQAGWDAVNVEGGMRAWAAAGRPMVAESSAAPKVL
ncbi:MAG TPA: rhodanese-like domain-containing protein [Pseudonocardiaceae bacterium]|jgi:rhodanese-related sulfurtransferase|nr:rhodanese-like domain-containing protein [Pseudonocardiaceae bacterium]